MKKEIKLLVVSTKRDAYLCFEHKDYLYSLSSAMRMADGSYSISFVLQGVYKLIETNELYDTGIYQELARYNYLPKHEPNREYAIKELKSIMYSTLKDMCEKHNIKLILDETVNKMLNID